MTTVRSGHHSPTGAGGQAESPLRMHAHASVSRPSRGGAAVTLSSHLEESRARSEAAARHARIYLAGGAHRKALNIIIGELQAALAAEARRRPGDAPGLYGYFIEQISGWIADLPGLEPVRNEEAS